MATAKRARKGVFFPWEKRTGLLGVLGRTRFRWVLLAVLVFTFLLVVRHREERAAATRSTRATITTAGRAMSVYRAAHGGACPKELGALVADGILHDVPVDAWGHPLRITCPGRLDPKGFDISSDGPDGLPGGLDRVE